MDECTCTQEGYSPDCPRAFMQGGRLLHTLDNESRLKPRRYDAGLPAEQLASSDASMGHMVRAIEDEIESNSQGDHLTAVTKNHQLHTAASNHGVTTQSPNTGYVADEGLRLGQHGALDRFKPLTLNGVSMAAATIGGYSLDLGATAARARKYVPLPPVCLPLIFRDADLNFMHHFFQGMEMLIGRAKVSEMVRLGLYSRGNKDELLPAIKRIIMSGHVNEDTELSTFVKRVLASTYDTAPTAGQTGDPEYLTVASNFYGFQYIEVGMKCQESELQMWLHMAYTQYRMAWFNAFKSSGIPAFAMEGVQDRYNHSADLSVALGKSEPVAEMQQLSLVGGKAASHKSEVGDKIRERRTHKSHRRASGQGVRYS